jgi:hypothetical protein
MTHRLRAERWHALCYWQPHVLVELPAAADGGPHDHARDPHNEVAVMTARQVALALYRSPFGVPVRPLLRRCRTSVLMPAHWMRVWRVCRILAFDYGFVKSAATRTPVGADGAPCPWYTYPALDYLRQLDFAGKTIFEYGCGHSTLFWAGRAAGVVSVEHDRSWYELLNSRLPPNCTLIYEPQSDAYAEAIDRFDRFDVIVVDGLVTGRTRLKCARAALRRLRRGGMIILDNSDWLPESARLLREAGLIQVDMTGFAPANDYTCATSFFFDREFAFEPLHDRQPVHGPGARPYNWEAGAMRARAAGRSRPESL